MGGGEQTDLTARIRALYEDTSVPVREIAGIAGVTERTLYKYVARGGWKKRYAVLPRGEAAAASNRGRGWAATEGRAPAKGAGGRFIRREDIGKPFPTGLKALDATARAEAHARCDKAFPLAQAARADAASERLREAVIRALATVNGAQRDLAAYRAERKRVDAYRQARAVAARNPAFRMPKPLKLRFADSPLTQRAWS